MNIKNNLLSSPYHNIDIPVDFYHLTSNQSDVNTYKL